MSSSPFAIGPRDRDLLLGVDLAEVAAAVRREHHHVLVLFVEEMMHVLGDLEVLLEGVEAVAHAFEERALAVQDQAEEAAGLVEGELLLLGLGHRVPEVGAVEGDELGAHRPLRRVEMLRPVELRRGVVEELLGRLGHLLGDFRDLRHGSILLAPRMAHRRVSRVSARRPPLGDSSFPVRAPALSAMGGCGWIGKRGGLLPQL
jgi:hypothetical protein